MSRSDNKLSYRIVTVSHSASGTFEQKSATYQAYESELRDGRRQVVSHRHGGTENHPESYVFELNIPVYPLLSLTDGNDDYHVDLKVRKEKKRPEQEFPTKRAISTNIVNLYNYAYNFKAPLTREGSSAWVDYYIANETEPPRPEQVFKIFISVEVFIRRSRGNGIRKPYRRATDLGGLKPTDEAARRTKRISLRLDTSFIDILEAARNQGTGKALLDRNVAFSQIAFERLEAGEKRRAVPPVLTGGTKLVQLRLEQDLVDRIDCFLEKTGQSRTSWVQDTLLWSSGIPEVDQDQHPSNG